MHKVTVGPQSFQIDSSGDRITVDGQTFEWDVQKLNDSDFHIITGTKTYSAEIVKIDRAAKTVDIKVNGRLYSASLKDQFDLLLEKMGMNAAAGAKVNNIKAPMPGLIIDMRVTAGDQVKQGDSLLILEAMKMENIIKSPGDGVVKSVKVKKGDSVEKNQVLIEF